MKKTYLLLSALLGAITLNALAKINPEECPNINKVIIWGHKSRNHTHYWIHHGYFRTFKHLGFETYWLKDALHEDFDFSNSLFLAHGLEEKYLPKRDDCRYILHNIEKKKYQDLIDADRAILLQVYTHDCIERDVIEIDDLTYIDIHNKVVYMPWATDLLPHEIDQQKERIASNAINKENVVKYVGSVGRQDENDPFENVTPIQAFFRGCQKHGIGFTLHARVPMQENIALVQRSIMAPALQSKWQCEKGYIPCRILKNISYGQMGITNSETVYKLLKKKVIYNNDPEELASQALDYI